MSGAAFVWFPFCLFGNKLRISGRRAAFSNYIVLGRILGRVFTGEGWEIEKDEIIASIILGTALWLMVFRLFLLAVIFGAFCIIYVYRSKNDEQNKWGSIFLYGLFTCYIMGGIMGLINFI
ncbi:MAG: hypothetical protein WC834_02915 [Eubacteriales bacterium]